MSHSHNHEHSHAHVTACTKDISACNDYSHTHEHSEHCNHSSNIAAALMPGLDASKVLQKENQFDISQRRIVDLTQRISRVESNLKNLENDVAKGKNSTGDWTQSYKYWNQWEDIEELETQARDEESNLKSMYEKSNIMGHCHDHGEERKMFNLPEDEKIKFCERHRVLGNYLFEEGLLPKAAEQYQTALSFYEYCFPDDDAAQQRLDSVRFASLCNLTLCYLRMGLLREAEGTASQAVREAESDRSTLSTQVRAKAYYRRAQTYRLLDEYERALADLRTVLMMCPEDAVAKSEVLLVQQQKKSYLDKSQAMAAAMLSTTTSSSTTESADGRNPLQTHPALGVLEKYLDKANPGEITSLHVDIPLEPNLKDCAVETKS